MASNYWRKIYHEMLDDTKVMTLSPDLRWRFIETILVAGELDQDGLLPPIEEYAWRIRDTETQVRTDFDHLISIGLLTQKGERIIVTKFADRQSPMSGAERTKRYREAKQADEYYVTKRYKKGNNGVTDRHNLSSDMSRDDVTDRHNYGGNQESDATVTNRRADKIRIDKDIDKNRIEIDGDQINEDGVFTDLSAAFVNKTGIPELTGGPSRWYDSLIRMGEAGVKPIDIENAVDILRDRDYTIVSLRSVENTAIGQMSKRTKGTRIDPDSPEARNKYAFNPDDYS